MSQITAADLDRAGHQWGKRLVASASISSIESADVGVDAALSRDRERLDVADDDVDQPAVLEVGDAIDAHVLGVDRPFSLKNVKSMA